MNTEKNEQEAGLKPGDVVRLKSGGPAMTISTPASHGLVICVWFDDNKALQWNEFHPFCLTKEESKKSML